MNSVEIAKFMYHQLEKNKEFLKDQFLKSKESIGFFYLDDLLPEALTLEIHSKFPALKKTVKRKSLREYKFTAYQMNTCDALLEEVIYAFQDKKVIEIVA